MKRTYLLIILCIIIIIIIGVIIVSRFSKQGIQQNTLISPTPIQNTTPNRNTITGTPIPTIPSTSTNGDSAFQSSIDTKQQLSATDITAKQNLINSLGTNQETVYQTPNFTVTYIRFYDMFQVAVDTTNVSQAENEAVTWFATKGISKDAVCKIPVQFYPSWEVNQALQKQGIQMPPLAVGC